MTSDPIHPDKRERLNALCADRGYEAVWFARPAAFAWLTGGDNVVDRTAAHGVAAVGYDGDGLRVLTDTIEAPRLRAEELPDGVSIETFPWHETTLGAAVADRSPTPAAADWAVPAAGIDRIDAGPLRQPLTDAEIDRYRTLGREVAGVLETVCRDLTPSDTERGVAASLRGRLADHGIDSPVVLVGGAERAPAYRHYTPKPVELGEYALASVTAQRDGLFCSCTRTVAFDPPAWLADRHAAAARVEVTALAATRRAARRDGDAGDVFAAIQDAYATVGYAGEWEHHHQGGAAGYAGREWVATPDATAPVTAPMAYAWNPTVQGAKSEDTVLVTEDTVRQLSTGADTDWPTETVAAVGDFDLEMTRPRPLWR